MLLSIGMIVKNEEKYLRDCLISLKPVLDAVDSELIIFDTGSTDTTVEIAKEFTNQVFEIEWRNDFAWARNHTLDIAKGKWFMFVDADEIFTDTTDLISFFNTGEYKKYKCAGYRWRNIFGENLYGLFSPLRLFEMEKSIRFVGKIHETIYHKFPMKNLESIADHFGYLNESNEDKEKMKAKHDRNISLMLEMLEEDPKDTRIMGLLAQEYMAIDLDKACEYLQMGLKITNESPDNMIYHSFNFMLIRNRYRAKNFEEVIKITKKYLKNVNKIKHVKDVCQSIVHVYHHYTNALMMTGEKHEALKAARETLKYCDLNQQGKLNTFISYYCVLPWELLNNRELHARTLVLVAAMNGDFDTAFAHVSECDDKIDVFDTYMKDCVEHENWNDIPLLYAYALKSGVESNNHHNAIAAIEKHIKNPDIKKNISEAMSNAPAFTNKNDDYIRLHILRHENATSVKKEGITQNITDGLDYFLKSNKSFSQHYGDVIIFAMKLLTDFSKFAENMLIIDSAEFIAKIMLTNKDAPGIFKRFVDMGRWDNSSVKLKRIMSNLATLAFEQVKKTDDETEKIAFFEMTMRLNHKYLNMIYMPNVYSAQNVTSLSENDAFVFYAGTAYECKDNGDILGLVRNLRTAVAVVPNMKDIVWLVVNYEAGENK